MPPHQVAWNYWTLEEEMMLVYFASCAFELEDVVHIMRYKLGTPLRQRQHCIGHIERLNRRRGQGGQPRLCEEGMANWNQAAVKDYLIHSTSDSHFLQTLLWFHPEYIPLLRTACPTYLPTLLYFNLTRFTLSLSFLLT